MAYQVLELSYSKPRRRPSLKKMDTRKLKNMLDTGRACGGVYFWLGSDGGPSWTTDELKAELSTREHIPNKAEAKKIRQEIAKAKRNR